MPSREGEKKNQTRMHPATSRKNATVASGLFGFLSIRSIPTLRFLLFDAGWPHPHAHPNCLPLFSASVTPLPSSLRRNSNTSESGGSFPALIDRVHPTVNGNRSRRGRHRISVCDPALVFHDIRRVRACAIPLSPSLSPPPSLLRDFVRS